MDIAALRKDYTMGGLRRKDLKSDPVEQFQLWFSQAITAQVSEPNAMTLATVDPSGQPSSRIVLVKGVDYSGFSFFTNFDSRKGRELEANPKASLTFFWPGLERQVGIRGVCSKLSREEAATYFKSRPIGSQWSAWVSKQSGVIESRTELETRLEEVKEQFGEDVPLPEYWGGFVLAPEVIEFWQGRASRLHDRFRYTRQANGWLIERLSP
ncbi:MAG: pyridoxamine 5'-phosphate oxidase [Verrucomicrobiales bacterium]